MVLVAAAAGLEHDEHAVDEHLRVQHARLRAAEAAVAPRDGASVDDGDRVRAMPRRPARSSTAATTSGIVGSIGVPGGVDGGDSGVSGVGGERAAASVAASWPRRRWTASSGAACRRCRSRSARYRRPRRPVVVVAPHAARTSDEGEGEERAGACRWTPRAGGAVPRHAHLLLQPPVEGGEEVLGVQERGVRATSRARSLVISPSSTASMQTCSRVSANRVTSGVPSSLPRCLARRSRRRSRRSGWSRSCCPSGARGSGG